MEKRAIVEPEITPSIEDGIKTAAANVEAQIEQLDNDVTKRLASHVCGCRGQSDADLCDE